MSMLRPAVVILMLGVLACSVLGDSIFDQNGIGRDVIPATGHTRALAGAVTASKDPLACSILNPFAAAISDKITISTGFSHTGTKTKNVGEETRTVTTIFPSVALTVPLKGFSVMTGLFLEKQGRVSLTMRDTAYTHELFDIDYRRESSVHSVPVLVSAAVVPRLIVSGGILISFLDIREKTTTDFVSDERVDARDINDTYAIGKSFAGGFLLDLDRVRLGALFRTKADLDATLDRENRYAGIWSSEDFTISSDQAFGVGLWVSPAQQVTIEADYHRNPWADVTIDDIAVTAKRVERWSIGASYRGDYLWSASKYPLVAGYYRQPLAWESDLTGEITEEFWSLGTSIPVGEDRASISVALEMGRRLAQDTDDLHETIYGLSISVSASEAWRREIRR
ncbi:MAG: hypothetical protein ABIJ00_14390 [Candidatus Eisenbacteria bacterium]